MKHHLEARPESTVNLESDASTKVLWPVLGLFSGLLLGWLRAWISGASELALIALVISGGMVGSGLGMAAVFMTLYPVRTLKAPMLKGLMVLVLLAALVLWWILRGLADLLIHGT
jgi:hypothetical protein